jgi:phage shock protein C
VKKLYRSRHNRMIWGVCSGLANYFGLDPTLIRVLFVISAFCSGMGLLAYIIMAILIPLEPSSQIF